MVKAGEEEVLAIPQKLVEKAERKQVSKKKQNIIMQEMQACKKVRKKA